MEELNYSLLHHTLGIDENNKRTYRNYFATSENATDYPDLMRLVDAGYMEKRESPSWSGCELTFYVTDSGKVKAFETLPEPPKLTRGKRRYQAYLALDCCEDFGQFLKDPYYNDYRKSCGC